MWEITLIGKKQDFLYFYDLIKRIKEFCSNTITALSNEENCVCSIAIEDNVGNITKIQELIISTIIKIGKTEFINNNLKCFGSNKSFNSFLLSILVVMDLGDEIEYVLGIADLKKVVYVHSFIMFKLKELKKLWKNLCIYINMTFKNTYEDMLYLEFLRMLIGISSSQAEVLYLEMQNDSMVLIDKNNRIVSKTPITDEVGVIVNIVLNAPQKLILNCFDSLSENFKNIINFIMEDRLSRLI